jgi:hypothetical protein
MANPRARRNKKSEFLHKSCKAVCSNAKTASRRAANSSASPMDTWTAEWLAAQRRLLSNTQQKTRFLLMDV